MLYLKRKESYVLFILALLIMMFSYKLGFLGAVSTVYGLMLIVLVLGLIMALAVVLIILAYVYIKELQS